MKWYILRRAGASLLTLFIATVVVFLGVRALPGGPAVALSAETSDPAVLKAIQKEYGLDKPLPVQYADWIGHALHGNLGNSPRTGLSVSQTLAERIPITLELTVLALLIALVIGLPLGILAAVRRGSVPDYLCSTGALVGLSVPHFWLGILFILAIAVHLHALPASGFVPLGNPLQNLAHMIMPAFVLGIGLAAVVMRQMRSAMLDSLGADYVRTARAKGMGEWRVIGLHALRNSLVTVVTVVGLQLGALISGAVITEQIFIIPGIGKLTIDSVFSAGRTDAVMTARLEVEGLTVRFRTDEGPVLAVNDLSFAVGAGQVLALVGESGCGKSMTAMAILGLLPPTATRTGTIRLDGREITGLRPAAMRQIRGKEISMIFQEPMTSLNPSFTIGFQIAEVLHRHEGISRKAARAKTVELLDLVRMPAPAKRVDEYPHQLSGGMRQRVMIAMAVACNPQVLIADEPTTALDVTIQAQILDIMRDLRGRLNTSIIMITHDLGVVADIADDVVVMYAGHRVETGPVDKIFAAPQHPYTLGLLGAVPRPDLVAAGAQGRLREIPGLVPTLRRPPSECVFAPRCPRADAPCRERMPVLVETAPGQRAACVHPGAQTAVRAEEGAGI